MFSELIEQCRVARLGLYDLVVGLLWLFVLVTVAPAGMVFAIVVHHNWIELFEALAFGWIVWMQRDVFVRSWPSQIWERTKVTHAWHQAQLAEGRRLMALHEEQAMNPYRRW